MVIDGTGGGLDKKNVHSADVFANLQVSFAVREGLNKHFAQRASQSEANLLGQWAVGSTAKNLEVGEQGPGWFRGRHRRLIGRSKAARARCRTKSPDPELTVLVAIDEARWKRSTSGKQLS